MNKLRAKLKKDGGFTLVEMLIVVAIIAILIAISIPMINTALEKSRHAVDQANMRDAVALANIMLLTDDTLTTGGSAVTYDYYVHPDSHQGELVKTGGTAPAGSEKVKPSCKCSGAAGESDTLQVTIDPAKGEVKLNWTTDNTPTDSTKGMTKKVTP